MKHILSIIFPFLLSSAYGQDTIKPFVADWMVIDSIRKNFESKISSDSMAMLEEKELETQLHKYTKNLVGRGIVTYPYGMLHYDLSSTYRMILIENGINFNDYIKENNCVNWSYYIVYYADMLNYFESKFGKGYFDNIYSQADSLDKMGMGLKLPHIINSKGISLNTNNLLSEILIELNSKESMTNLCLTFRVNNVGKVFDIEICRLGIPGLFMANDLTSKYSTNLIVKFNSYKWEYAKFKNKFIDQKFVFKSHVQRLQIYQAE